MAWTRTEKQSTPVTLTIKGEYPVGVTAPSEALVAQYVQEALKRLGGLPLPQNLIVTKVELDSK